MNVRWPKLCLCFFVFCLGACSGSGPDLPIYEDVTELSGLQFVHQNGSDNTLALPPILGSGVALFDVDNDGDLDIYLVQGRGGLGGPDEIWINESEGDRLRFDRAPDQPAFASDFPGMGVAVGDANLDGRLDVAVTTLGVNRLLLNHEAGFVVSGAGAGAFGTDEAWSASLVWLDANGDQRPDVYIANVAEFDASMEWRSITSRPDYCDAGAYVPLHDQLLLNIETLESGDVVFEDVSLDWNLVANKAPSLGVRAGDFNNDGLPDVYVASPGAPNTLWLNERGRRFSDLTRSSGAAASFLGRYRGSFGVDAADMDGDDDLDLVVSHSLDEPHQVYLNDGLGNFIADDLIAGGVSASQSGAGLVVLDANTDGFDDVFVANGATRQRQAQLDAGDLLPLRESNTLFLQSKERGYQPEGGTAAIAGTMATVDTATPPAHGEANVPVADAPIEFDVWEENAERLTPRPHASRSVASGDLDNDGDLDLVITNNGGPAQILRSTRNPENWIGISAVSEDTGLAVTGARVKQLDPEAAGTREIRRSHGYLSASDPRLIFYHLPEDAEFVTYEVTWPGAPAERFTVPVEPRYHSLIRGQGQP